MYQAARNDYWAGLTSAALLVAAAALVWLIPTDPAFVRANFTVEHVEFLGMPDNRGQQWAHRTVVALLALLALGLAVARPFAAPQVPPLLKARLDAFLGEAVAALALAYVALVLVTGAASDALSFHGRYGLLPAVSVRTQIILGIAGAVAVYAWWRIEFSEKVVRGVRIAVLGAAAIYVVALLALALGRMPSFAGFTPPLEAGVEWHYSGSLASADRLATGARIGDVPIYQSMLGSVLLGIAQKLAGLDFGGHIRFISALQALMVLIAALAYGAWYSWRAGAWLAALLLALPWIQPLQAAVLYPNQSGWRFLGLCAGIALLALSHRSRARWLPALLGFAGGLGMVWNPETGLVVNLAYVVFLFLDASRPRWRTAALYVAGAAASWAVFCVVVRAGLGYWPGASDIAGTFQLLVRFSVGYGGLRFRKIEPLPLLVFAHALFVLTRGILDWASAKAQPPHECARIAIAALLVVWSAYYFRAPDPWNLWSLLLVYGYFVGDLVPAARRAGEMRPPALPMILGMIVVPALVTNNFVALRSGWLAAVEPPCAAANVVSGVCFPATMAPLVREKAETLRERSQAQPVLYFSAHSYVMPLESGVPLPLRQRDAFAETLRVSDFDALVADVRALGPACILYDDPRSPLSGYEAHRRFYARLRAALARDYAPRASERGWQVDCRMAAR